MKTEKSLALGNVSTIAGLTLIVFLAGVVLRLAKPVLFPFLLAVVLSFIVTPVLDFLVRIKIPRAVAIILILILTFFVLYLLGMLIFESGKGFASEIPKYAEKLRTGLDGLVRKLHLSRTKSPSIAWLASLDVNKLGEFFVSSLGPFLSFITNLFLVLIFLVSILAGKGQTEKKIGNALDPTQAARMRSIIKNINYQIQRYLAIKTISNLIMGILTAGILTIFGVNYALLFGFLAFVLNYIPTIGSIIATGLPMLIAAFQFPSMWPAVWIGLLMTIMQNIQGNFVEPKLVGRGLGLSPLVILFALFFWAWLWGIAGMLLAVPIVAMVKIVCDNVPGLKLIAVMMSH
jgi:predicted PurR-regulated permease PerM